MNRVVLTVVLLGLGLVALVWSAANTVAFVTNARAAAPQPIDLSASAVVATRQSAIDRIRQLNAIVRRADRIEAKLTTFGEYELARRIQLSTIQRIATTKAVWLVTAAGEIVPAFAKPLPNTNRAAPYRWAIFVLDPDTGDVLTTHAGTDGAWPVFFDMLIDRAP